MTDEHDDCFGAYQHLNKEYKESRTFTMGKVSCWGLKNTSFKKIIIINNNLSQSSHIYHEYVT